MSRALLALVAGALLPFSMSPFHIWPLGLVSLALWFALLMTVGDRRRGRGLGIGFLYGVGLYGIGVSWVYVSIHQYGGASPLLAGLLVCVFAGGMALFPMLSGWLFVRLKSESWVRSGAWFVIVIVAFEWLLTWFLTGFPWLAVGYGQLDGPLAGFAPVGGVALVSAMTTASSVAIVLFARELLGARRSVPAVVLAGISLAPLLVGWGLGRIPWTEPGAARTAALVQGNVAQSVKWEPDSQLPIIRHYRSLTEPYWGTDLILWPEAAITVFEHQAGKLLELLDERGRQSGSALVLGLPALEVQPGGGYAFLNTARGLGTASGQYVKRRLVPFGEYVPLEGLLRGLIEFFDLPMSHAESGPWSQAPLKVDGERASMAICYEIVYPELVRSDVDVLLTISNDTWFGDSIGPWQHLGIARMRALENGRWLLRATNNGITGIVDPHGAVLARLPRFEAGVLTGEYRVMRGRTPFNRLGPYPLYGVLLLVGLVLAATGRRSAPGEGR